MFHHACAGSNGGDAEAVSLSEGFDHIDRNVIWAGKEEFDIIEADFFREGEALGEGFVENEGACGGFRNLAKGDGSAHLKSEF